MAVTTFHPLLLLLLLLRLLVVTANGTSKPVKYQTLVVNPLRSPPPLLPEDDIAIETMATADEAEVTLPVPSPVHVHLTNRDSLLAASATAEHIFALCLDRYAGRVETIAGNNFEPWPRDQRGSVRVRKMWISLGALLEPAEEVGVVPDWDRVVVSPGHGLVVRAASGDPRLRTYIKVGSGGST